MTPLSYDTLCFVIMPFGQRTIGDKSYDFDAIYSNLFEVAISMAALPDGRHLTPKRADSSSTAGIITQEMFRDILYSRIVLADITGLNPNVFYELGVRHALRPTSTVVFKEVHSTIPFDVRDLRIFDYDIDGLAGFGGAVQKIKKSLTESLAGGVMDSPVVAALRDEVQWPSLDVGVQARYKLRSWLEGQRERDAMEAYIREARASIDRRDLAGAEASLRGASALVPDDLRVNMELAALLRDRGAFGAAEPILRKVTETHPSYAPAWRELGIATNKLKKANDAVKLLQKAVALNPFDTDAWNSLGGALKALGQFGEAQDAYRKSLSLNEADPYALLNYFALHAQNNRSLPDLRQYETALHLAEDACNADVLAHRRLPWAYFDLAQIYFFKHDSASFENKFSLGAKASTARWQVETAAKSYALLRDAGIKVPNGDAAAQFAEKVLADYGK